MYCEPRNVLQSKFHPGARAIGCNRNANLLQCIAQMYCRRRRRNRFCPETYCNTPILLQHAKSIANVLRQRQCIASCAGAETYCNVFRHAKCIAMYCYVRHLLQCIATPETCCDVSWHVVYCNVPGHMTCTVPIRASTRPHAAMHAERRQQAPGWKSFEKDAKEQTPGAHTLL